MDGTWVLFTLYKLNFINRNGFIKIQAFEFLSYYKGKLGFRNQRFFHYFAKISNATYSKVSNECAVSNNRTVGWHCFTKSFNSARALCFSHCLGPRDSKKNKFGHLEEHLVVSSPSHSLQVFDKGVEGGFLGNK